MFNYQVFTIIFTFCFVSLRFCASFALRLHCLNLSKNIAFLAAFLAVSHVFLSFVCVCLCRHKRPLFWPLLAVNFSMHPQPLIDPHRDRGCLSELFFFYFFSFSLPTICLPASKFFFRNFFFAFYLTANSHFYAIVFLFF